jgi:hypothetical protein
MADKKITARVTARADGGFRRGGRYWPATPTDIELTRVELEQLQAEPQLVVLVLGDEPEGSDNAELEAKVKKLEDEKKTLEPGKGK